ncbi:hypothetical protein [Nocardioides sp.]|uniref:hypothetical protein n=1 Tax=Nocardioides sp. TaxID=35761 RepID=UPI0039E4C079
MRRRKLEQPSNDIDAVFASRNGTWHFPGNVQSRLWHIRQLDEYADIDAAKDQLGHTSKTVTERHYINRRLVLPDYRAATERLAPRSDPADESAIGL